MSRRFAARTLSVPLLVALCLAGCNGATEDVDVPEGAVPEEAESIASDVAGSATSAATSVVQEQVCGLVEDADVSTVDLQVLRGLIEGADEAGLDSSILDPARRIVDAGEDAPEDAVAELEEACAG